MLYIVSIILGFFTFIVALKNISPHSPEIFATEKSINDFFDTDLKKMQLMLCVIIMTILLSILWY